ncbi:PepSY domain-containing protein [Thiohalobacter sp. IOR34]|uniref:PepSY domain-containing protein n=1 Tax=Thiohalobacter sp. IOR34 TaxID=3057176 RepID=UPI0025B1E308|nr:PepSY domain-containing protein [Thiohalobacter sp. IOR34]WJW74305.1 PepSY domain-containing protein [Thiohalobacter sp. IOR34]
MRTSLLLAAALAALLLGLAALWLTRENDAEHGPDEGRPAAGHGIPASGDSGPLPLQELVRRLHLPPDTRILEIERKQGDGRLLYEIELLTPDQRVYELLVDPRSGEVLEQEEEEDGDAFAAGGR